MAVALALVGCGGGGPAVPPPPASFLAWAGDSTFWIELDSAGPRVRRSAMLLAEVDGRFHETYLADDDRSYHDAVLVSQRVYRRDLVTGDSVVLLADGTIPRLADAWAARHPGDRPLAPDEDAAESPALHASTDTELLDVLGPYLSYEQHVDIDGAGAADQHVTRRGVVDLRTGQPVTLATLAGADGAARVEREGRRLLSLAVDSIRAARDDRARRAEAAIGGFTFDPASWTLEEEDGRPVVRFLVPGRGGRAGGLALPLAAIPLAPAPWWQPVAGVVPARGEVEDTWRGPAYDVVALPAGDPDRARLVVRAGGGEHEVARVPQPVRRVRRLDAPRVGDETLHALRRAFVESAFYTGEAATARHDVAPPTMRAVGFTRASRP